jgi:ABC-2 type transport system ATP-binding protein
LAGAAVELEDLCVLRGGRRVLPGISLEVDRGSVTGLLGPSGCGKTTLMRSIVGVQIIESGAVRVLGEAAGSPALRRRVGYLTQAPSVYGDLSVRENLGYFARVLGVPSSRVEELIETVHLGDHADRPVGRLSGGQRARVSLASALIGQPELLVLDEPTVGQDPVLRVEFWQMFARLASEGTTLLVSSHVMDEAVHCDHLLLMRDGEILVTASPSAVMERTGASDMEDAFLRLIGEGSGQ